MKTTKRELLEMLADMPNDAEIVLQVRGNSTTDYSEQRIVAFESTVSGRIIIMDKLSE